jgi:hypothetical protein
VDEALRELERALREGDEGARVRFASGLLHAGRVEQAWQVARERSELARMATEIFESAGAPYTLAVIRWPLRGPGPEPVRLLGRDCRAARIGRRADVELRLDHPLMAPLCCLVRYEGGTTFRLLDLGSYNGTWIREQRVQEVELGERSVFSPAAIEIEVAFTLGWSGEPWPQSARGAPG